MNLAHCRVLACLIATTSFLAIPLSASQEGTLPWSAFTIQTDTNDSSTGGVTVTGTQAKEGINSLKVKAFQREFVLSESQLKKLRGFNANGLLVSFETGWKEFGGRTLYLTFQSGFVSGVQNTLVVRLNEHGEVKIEKPAVRPAS